MEFVAAFAEVAELAREQRPAVDGHRSFQDDQGVLEVGAQWHGFRTPRGANASLSRGPAAVREGRSLSPGCRNERADTAGAVEPLAPRSAHRLAPTPPSSRRASPGAFVGSCYSATLGRALILRVSETLGPGSVRPAGAGCRPRAPSFGFCSRHIDAAPLCVRVREVLAPSAAGVGAADHRDWAVCMMQHGLAHRSEQ